MLDDERQRVLAAARETLLEHLPDAVAIYAYGSFARGDDWPQSDIDLAVLLPPGRAIPDVLGTIAILSAQTKRDIDLIDLRRVGSVLIGEVLRSGQLLYAADPDTLLAWEASAMSRYAHHREEIRDILADFQKSGIGYAP
jgi:uncharacterized protein